MPAAGSSSPVAASGTRVGDRPRRGLAVAYALPVSSELIRLVALAAVFFPLLYVLKVIPSEVVGALVRRGT